MIANYQHGPRRGLVPGLLLLLALGLVTLTGAGAPASALPDEKPIAPPAAPGEEEPEEPAPATPPPPAVELQRIRVEHQDEEPEWMARLAAKLEKTKVTFEFDGDFLLDAIAKLRESTSVNLVVDSDSKETFQNTQITLKVENLALGAALDLLLRFADGERALAHGAVLLGESGSLPPPLEQRVYNLGPLFEQLPAHEQNNEAHKKELACLLEENVLPETWEDYDAMLTFWGDLMIVRQTAAVQARIERVLNALLNGGREPAAPPAPGREALERALKTKLSVNFKDTPLQNAATYVAQMMKANVLVDPLVAEDEWVIDELRIKDGTAEDVLRLIAEKCDTDVVLRNGVVIIGPDRYFEQRFYDVRDLISNPVKNDGRQPDQLAELITSSVDPESWGEWEDAEIAHWNGILMISQTERNHGRIEKLLEALRRARK